MDRALQHDSLATMLLGAIFRNIRLVAAFFSVVVLSAAMATLAMPRVYEANGTLLVRLGQENLYRSEVGETINLQRSNERQVVSLEVEILQSDNVLRSVVREIGSTLLYPEPLRTFSGTFSAVEGARRRLAEDLKVRPGKDAATIAVTFRHQDPQVAAEVINALFSQYMQRRQRVFTEPRSEFVAEQVSAMKRDLGHAEDRLQRAKEKYGIVSLVMQRDLLLNRKAAAESELLETRARIPEKTQQIAALENHIKSLPREVRLYSEGDRYKSVDDAVNELLTLRLRRESLSGRMGENNPEMRAVQAQIEVAQKRVSELEADARAKSRTGLNPVYQQLQVDLLRHRSDLESAQARSLALLAEIRKIEDQVTAIDGREIEIHGLERERDLAEASYRLYQTKLTEVQITDEFDKQKVGGTRVLQEAVVPEQPVSRLVVHAALALSLGVFGGIGLAILRESLRSTFSTPLVAERELRLPLLATVPFDRQLRRA